MRLSALLPGAPDGIEIAGVTSDSRLVKPGFLFVAVPGTMRDGADFIPQAIERGAAAVLVERRAPRPPDSRANPVAEAATAPLIPVDDAREALAIAAANFYGNPADRVSLIGVTGTSGKTTTTRMIEAIFDAGGEPAGLIGTIEYRAGDERLMADRTTPDAVVLHEWLAKMVQANVRHAVMEVSSHALALKRTYGIRFAAAVFTNLSRDHFDFHSDFEDYFAAKKILFDQIDRTKRCAVINRDDEYGRRLIGELGAAALTFGRGDDADIHPASSFEISASGLRGGVVTPSGEVEIDSSLIGLPNLYNWLAAIGAATTVGIARDQIEAGVRRLKTVRGRFERVGSGDGPTVIVDYAHKPDALEKLLHAVRELAEGKRLVLLFGCGGGRDRGKRPEMGAIAGRLADFVVLTSDNARDEEPEKIIDDIEAGMGDVPRDRYERVSDRRDAIARSIERASEQDVIVIAGKGHETYQVTGDRIAHFDDREEAEMALARRAEKVTS